LRALRSSPIPKFKVLALLGALSLLLTACPSPTEEPEVVETPPDDDTPPPAVGVDEPFTFNSGIFEDTTTDNFWAHFDPDLTIWNAYLLNETSCSLYGVEAPTFAVVPDTAAHDWEPAQQDGDVWFVEVEIREDAVWSDGEPVTANDFVFTFNAVRDFSMAGNWISYWHPEDPEDPEATAVVNVEAVEDKTVRIEFNNQPGLAFWPHDVGVNGAIQAEHFWDEVVEGAATADDIYNASGAGAPSCGSVVFEEREAGAFASVSRNDTWHRIGEQVRHFDDGTVEVDGTLYGGPGEGEVTAEYTIGPFFEDEVFTLYGAQDSAVLALRQGEVDYLYNPLGMERGLQDPVLDDPDLEAISNPAFGIRYMAYNFRKAPMNDKAFRQALSTVIDREFMADSVLGGVAFPLFQMMPPGNVAWYDEEQSQRQQEGYVGIDEFERLERAVGILREAGYSWQQEPAVTRDDDGEPVDIQAGSGLTMPDGQPVPDLELLTPGPGYDPLRATYGVWIERWAQELGIPLRANLTGFGVIVDAVFVDPEPDWDLYILGWSLGNPAIPTFYESFFHSRHAIPGGNNAPAFQNAEFDAAVDRFMAAATEEEAYEILWSEVEPILAEELPYTVLFDTPILEFYRRAEVIWPFTETIGGFQFQYGLKDLVRSAQ
jgi:peptide/nickel transport system substrate-binding protein